MEAKYEKAYEKKLLILKKVVEKEPENFIRNKLSESLFSGELQQVNRDN